MNVLSWRKICHYLIRLLQIKIDNTLSKTQDNACTYLRLKPELQEGRDFALVPEECIKQYGVVHWRESWLPPTMMILRVMMMKLNCKEICCALLNCTHPENGTLQEQSEKVAKAKAEFSSSSGQMTIE